MNINRNNYERQFNNESNKLNNNYNNKTNEQPFTNNIKVGRNEPRPVRLEDGTYNITSDVNYNNNFSHISMDFNKKILESQVVSSEFTQTEETHDKIEDIETLYQSNKTKNNFKFIKIIITLLLVLLATIICITISKGLNKVDILTCKNSNVDLENTATVEFENIYYFKNGSNYKTERIIKYSFKDRKSFDNYKNNYVDTSIYDISGISYENSFHTSNLSYMSKVIYDYNKIKKDKKNKSKDDSKIIIFDNNGNVLFDAKLLNKNSLLDKNKEYGYTCTSK